MNLKEAKEQLLKAEEQAKKGIDPTYAGTDDKFLKRLKKAEGKKSNAI